MKRIYSHMFSALLAALLIAITTSNAGSAQLDIVWNGGSGDWDTVGNWDLVLVPNNGADTYNVLIDDGNVTASDVTLSLIRTVDNVTLDSDDVLSINNTARLRIANGGVIDNAGTINLNSTGNDTYIQPDGGLLTLTGGGTLTLSDMTTNWIYQINSGSFTNVNNTIQGAGNLGWSGAPTAITNQGTVIANGTNPLSCNPGTQVFTNTGTLRADSGAVLTLNGPGGFDNATGIIEALNNSTVDIATTTIRGGTLQTSGTGVIQSASDSTELDGTMDTVTNAGLLRVPNSERFRMKGTINNTGTIEISSSGSDTYIHPRDTVMTLTGGGTVTMTDSDSNWIYQQNGGSLVNVNNTIQGAGNLGWSGAPTAITNQGTVVANETNNTLLCNAGSQVFTNTGILRADSGGVLTLSGTGGIANTGGVIEALDASVVELSGATIDGGTLQTSGSGVIRTVSVETLDGSVNPVTNAGTLVVQNADDLDLVGTVLNTGTIDLSSTGSVTELRAQSGNAMLTGSGVVNMGDDVDNRIRGATSTDRVINVDNTIQGAGNIGVNTSGFTNQGTVIANLTNTLTLDPRSTEDITNTGTLRADNGATLRLSGGMFFNAGGVIEALDGSVVELNSATVDGGTFQTTGSGEIRTVSAETLDGSVNPVTNAGTLVVQNADDLDFLGTLQNTGTIRLNSTGTSTEFRAEGGNAMLTGGGVVNMGDHANNRIGGVTSTDRVINVDNTIQGAGNIGVNNSGFTNQSTVIANLPTALVMDPRSTEDITNTGTLRADNGATLRLTGGMFFNAGGVIEALDTSVVELSSATIDGGTLQTTGSGEIRTVSTETLDGSVNPVTNAGTLVVRNGDNLNIAGTVQNSGTIHLNSTASTTAIRAQGGNAMLTGGGVVNMGDHPNNRIAGVSGTDRVINVNNTIQGAGNIGVNVTGFTNQGTVIANGTVALTIDPAPGEDFTNEGILQAVGASGLSIGPGPFTTSGTVTIASGSSISRTGDYTQTAGSTTVDGTLSATGIVDIQGGVLTGDGTVEDDVTNAGSVQPGASAGVFTIDAGYTQDAAGDLSIEIGGLTPGTEHDRLDVTGTANLGGTLTIEFINGFSPMVGDSFQIMTYGAHVGQFDMFDAPCLPAGRIVQVSVLNTQVVVSISDALIGDGDCDCALSGLDIEAFVLALLDPGAYLIANPNCPGLDAVDMNGDTLVNGLDVQPFLEAFLP
ncbi:MAG: hypothetical protein MI923_20575 [Phycisphaerales bacterium]|nr:hypothetical protein [Phycisphaerales bacterium]